MIELKYRVWLTASGLADLAKGNALEAWHFHIDNSGTAMETHGWVVVHEGALDLNTALSQNQALSLATAAVERQREVARQAFADQMMQLDRQLDVLRRISFEVPS